MTLSRTEAAGRAGAIAAGLGVGASLATLGIETERGETLAALLADAPEMLSVFGPLFAFTTYIAVRPLLSRAPGKIEQWIMSALTTVVLLGATLLLIAWATDKGDRFDQRWYYWIIVPWPLIAGIALGRATLATTWVSWSHKVAAVAFLMAPLSVLVVCQASHFGEPPDVVAFFVALTAYLIPVALYIVWPRKNLAEAAGSRGAAKVQ